MGNLQNPLKRARGLGSAKSGVGHFVAQRATAVALLVTGVYVLGMLLYSLHGGYAAAHAAVANPLNAVVLVAFLVAMCWHAPLGIQTVIEDYVHAPLWSITLLLLNRFVFALVAIAGVLSVVRIALGN